MPDDRNRLDTFQHPIDLSRETTSNPTGHRNLVWLWIIGMILLSAAIWGVAELATFLQPPTHGSALNGNAPP